MVARKIIFDTDPGVDDAMALLLLARHPEVDLMAVTTGFGNATIDTVTRNALLLKDRYGFAAPVARGAAGPLQGEAGPPPAMVHGENGLGDIELPREVRSTVHELPAHRLIIELVRRHPGEITVIAVGRMTNLALALAEAPEIAGLVHDVVVMGGAFGFNGHRGNVTPAAEANIHGDARAADIVFGAAWPVTIAGLDVTQQTFMSEAYLADLARTAGEDGRFVRAISAYYKDFHISMTGDDGFFVHDSTAITYALRPELFRTRRGAIRVVPDGIAEGETIIKLEGAKGPPGPWDGRPTQTICVDVDSQALLGFYRATLQGRA